MHKFFAFQVFVTFSIAVKSCKYIFSFQIFFTYSSRLRFVSGTGMLLFQVQLFYNVKQEPVEPSYALTVESKDESLEGYNLNICTR